MPVVDAEAATYLKPWLVRTLEPICDAEPGALADYILALLKHNAPESELRQELVAQLEEFLEKETTPFINTLFTALRTKSYMPYSAPSPPSTPKPSSSSNVMDGGIPIPLDGLIGQNGAGSQERRRKRSFDQDDRDFRAPKGPRLNDDGPLQRYDRGTWGRGERGGRMMISGRADYMDGGMMGGDTSTMDGRGSYRPPGPGRGICRDYHNNGYCARGAFCKYSHGEDAVVPGQLFGMPGGYTPVVPGGALPYGMPGMMNAQYDPHERIDMRPTPGMNMPMGGGRQVGGRPPVIPRQGDLSGHFANKPGELPVIQDLTPRLPADNQNVMMNGAPNGQGMTALSSGDVEMSLSATPMADTRNGYRGGRGGGRGGRGQFSDAAHIRPSRRSDKTLVVEKIPEDKLSLTSINDWFKKFGTITNVAVDPATSKALVTFSEHQEAHAAWKSEDAVFGNRFVKVFWHRPMEGHGQLGQRMLAASANLVAKVSGKEGTPQQSLSSPANSISRPTPTPNRKPVATSSALSAIAAKQQQLEERIVEQKSLMAKLSTASPDEKKEIMARLRKLSEEEAASTTAATPSTSSLPAKNSRGSTPRTDDQSQKEKERLDKELEIHAVATADAETDDTDELRARLAKLKAEAASLGISEGTSEPVYHGNSYRPYRGRGRGGRSFYRGAMRGGPPRASMKLDNRPKKLLVKGATTDQLQDVREWYETTGQVESVDVTAEGDVLVAFKSRSGAEQGLSKGSDLPMVGPVQISWYTGQTTGSASQHSPSLASPGIKDFTADRLPSPPPEISHMHEEEAVSGWGDDEGDDGFGMM